MLNFVVSSFKKDKILKYEKRLNKGQISNKIYQNI